MILDDQGYLCPNSDGDPFSKHMTAWGILGEQCFMVQPCKLAEQGRGQFEPSH